MGQSILSNLGVILLGHFAMSVLMNHREKIPKNILFFCIVVLFSSVIILLFYLPVQFGEFTFDLRLVPLFMLAIFQCWEKTLIILLIVSVWRFLMGGENVFFGVLFGMILPTLTVLAFNLINKGKRNIYQIIILITICWMISDFPIVLFVPNGKEIFQQLFLIKYISVVLPSIIYYALVLHERKRESLRQQLLFLASHDPLTKLLNKNHFIDIVEEKIKNPYYNHFIAMIDIDYFKKFNDKYGHLAGDQILISIASILKKYESDDLIASRYGGEEFIIYLRTLNSDQAIDTFQKLQNEIRNTSFQIESNLDVSITVSIGLAKIKKGEILHETIKVADQNLYEAKEKGRDQLIVVC
ncbi:GGDEF domain-containing protein [Calidifontibacillus erzurumensis]|uniref:GGDEF domain-containing protein n=1 Tax=Calidifontibacillus erzurumensis TaxID=2741433 RepID=UPI0035B526D4